MIPGMGMCGLVPDDADLVEKVHRLRRHGPLGLEAAQQVGLRLVCRCEKSNTGRGFLREQFAELSELDEAGVRIVAEITLAERAQPDELRVVRRKETKILQFDIHADRPIYLVLFAVAWSQWRCWLAPDGL